jgi:DNA-binding CsgD family transcriptional regulator
VSEFPVSRDELARLFTMCHALLAQERTLMTQLRTSMFEMQAQRARLRDELQTRASLPVSGGNGNGAAPVVATLYLEADYGLTPREVEVALLLAEGCSNAVVARQLGISPHTARHHTQRVLGKLGVHSRSEAGARLRHLPQF